MYVHYFPKVDVAVCMKQLLPKLPFTRASGKQMYITRASGKQMCIYLRGLDGRRHFKTNTVPENYVSAEVAFFHPSKVHISKHSNMSYDKPLLKEFKTNFVIDVPVSYL